MLSMPVVSADACRLHEPGGEVYVGVRTAGTESPRRLEGIRDALTGASFVEALPHDDRLLLEVHDASLVRFLAAAWDDWAASGLTRDPGQDRVVPYVFPHGANAGSATPARTAARAGRFCYDTMTLIGPGTWEAARAAVDAVLTAVDLAAEGAPAAYALVRPPGHHAGSYSYGGSCYLNNSAVAAAALAERYDSVAVLDVDAHHGNGTQEIFSGRDDVLTGSVHVDPGAGWFPHFVGFAHESDAGNRNLPLAPGTGDRGWLEAVDELAEWTRGAAALVVPLGVDAASTDPESPLEVTAGGFRRAGQIVGELGRPTVFVQEGGYDLESLGELVLETLLGFEESR
jgi:acetoin utilization deacetylase AcuC-like enzyme